MRGNILNMEAEETKETKENLTDFDEEQINIGSVLKDIHTKEKESAHVLELNNCIVWYGNGDINTINNSGDIQGDIYQGVRNASNTDGSTGKAKYDFSQEKDVKSFLRNCTSHREIYRMISVAFLECVPDCYWLDIKSILSDIFVKSGFVQEEGGQRDLFSSAQDELEYLQMRLVPAECVTALGRQKVNCIVYANEKIRCCVERTIWLEYYELKNVILKWLLTLKDDKQISEVLGYQIANALGRAATYDWAYFQKEVLVPLAEEGGNANRNYIVRIIKYYLKHRKYDKVLDEEIKGWIVQKNIFLWEVIYRLYGVNEQYEFNREIESEMEQYFEADRKWRCVGRGVLRKKWNTRIDIYPAYGNRKLKELILHILYRQYSMCSSYKEKTSFFDYFTWILMNDYKLEGYPNYQMMFLDVLENRDIRVEVRDMYWESWRRNNVKRIWGQLIEHNLVELEKTGRTWGYMKVFFF